MEFHNRSSNFLCISMYIIKKIIKIILLNLKLKKHLNRNINNKNMNMKNICMIFAFIIITSCNQATQIKTKGVVLEHNANYENNFNKVIYRTLIKCENGKIVERCGMNFYVVPKGDTVTLYFNAFEL